VVFHRLGAKEIVEALQTSNAASLWQYEYPTAYRDDFGFDEGPRATPTIAADKVFTFGSEGVLSCLEFRTGARLWSVDTKQQFHAPKGFFGMACSPLVDKNKVLLNVGGQGGAGIAAFDRDTGKLLWKSTSDEASYASPIDAAVSGSNRALFFTRAGLVLLNPDNGNVLTQYHWRSRGHASVNAATPLVINDLIFLSACYETGAVLLRLSGDQVTPVWSSDDVLSNHYATSVHAKGFLFGYHGRQEYGPSLRCVELLTGKVRWSQEKFGAGTLLLAGDKLVALKEDGELLLVAASADGYRELARAQILPNGVRAYPAIADGLFIARSKDKLVCVDLRTLISVPKGTARE
jgi:outer membrane protein assembly factor BamB